MYFDFDNDNYPREWPASQRVIYDPSTGKVIGRSSTDGQGTTTFYDAGGKPILRVTKPGDKR